MGRPLCQIVRVGARSPLGLRAVQVAMCVRAGKMEPRRTRVHDRFGNNIGAVRAHCLPDTLVGYDRMVALATPALREAALSPDGRPEPWGPVPMLLAVPEAGRADDDVRFGPELIAEIAEKASVPVDLERSLVVRAGHAGFGLALEIAMLRLWGTGDGVRAPAVLVGGVDSYFHPEVLQGLDRARRLHAATADNGILPSEGAAFVLLTTGEVDPKRGKERRAALASVLAVVSGREETVPGEEPNLAAAMTTAVRQALAAAGDAPGWLLTDLNGERHRVSEWAKVRIRLRDELGEDVQADTLADEQGDTGAASGALLLAIACVDWHAGCAPAHRALFALHAEGPERSAFIVEREAESEPVAPRLRAESPASREAPIHQETIDRVILSLARLPAAFDRAPAQQALEGALSALSSWAASDLDADSHLALLDTAKERVALAGQALEAAGDASAQARESLAHVEGSLRGARVLTIDRIVALQGQAPGPDARGESATPAFRASMGAPVVHAGPATPLVPLVRVEAPETDDDEGPRARPSASGAEESLDLVHVRALARDCMEDIAILGNLRHPHEDEPWSAVARFEQRLLCNLDALLSLARVAPHEAGAPDVLTEVLRYAMEPVFADAGRAFARAFTLACVGGEDVVRAAVSGLRGSHPMTHGAQREALCLASSPAVVPAMERLLLDDDPRLVRMALEVLHFRRAARLPLLLPLLNHPDPGVQREALACLSSVEPLRDATAILVAALGDAGDDRTALSAAKGLVLLGQPAGMAHLTDRLAQEDAATAVPLTGTVRAEIVRVLARAGGANLAALLWRAAQRSPEVVEALGWYGEPALVGPLLDALGHENEARHATGSAIPGDFETDIAQALVRITGQYLEDPDDAQGANLTTSAAVWRAHLSEMADPPRPGVKLRFGRPYEPTASLDELASPEATPDAREAAAFELSALSPTAWGFEAGDWVVRQEAQIGIMREQLAGEATPYEPGEWPAAYVARRNAWLATRAEKVS